MVSHPGPQAFNWAKLTDRGRAQAVSTARATELSAGTLVVTSDFARAYETARIAADIWGTNAPHIDIRLRERNFGSLEGGPSHRYDEVWAADALGASLPEGVETVHQVALRTQSLVTELLSLPGTCDIVLVAHGDVLQIAQTSIIGTSASAHRALPHLGNAELRLLLPRSDED